jgi:hypothetical protein
MRRRSIISLAATLAFACVVGVPSGGKAASGGCTVWTDPSGDTIPNLSGWPGPQADLARGAADLSGTTLVLQIHVASMSLQLPVGVQAETWAVQFEPNDITAQATLDATGMHYGDVRANDTSGLHVDAGAVVAGADGYVQIGVPLARTGLGVGDVASGFFATATVLTSAGAGWSVDDTGNGTEQSYVVGSAC